MCLEIFGQRKPADAFHQDAEYVGRNRIIPLRAGVELQWNLCQRINHALRCIFGPAFDIGLAIGGVDIALFLKTIGETSGVPQQINNPHLCLWRTRHKGHIAAAAHKNAQLRKFGDIFGDRIRERNQAPFHQLHERDRGNRFGHRRDAEDGIFGDARAPLQRDIIATADQHRRERQLAIVEIIGLNERRNSGEAVGNET